ncbi:MAG: radical SAM protein, partial [Candidatus Brocadiales bacterium]
MSETLTTTNRLEEAYKLLSPCRLCPRNCKAMRLEGQKGFCGIGRQAVVSSFGPHFGEERPLVGQYGSGTIFFAGCNLGCIFCQNWAYE